VPYISLPLPLKNIDSGPWKTRNLGPDVERHETAAAEFENRIILQISRSYMDPIRRVCTRILASVPAECRGRLRGALFMSVMFISMIYKIIFDRTIKHLIIIFGLGLESTRHQL
jgi:hypothetical protein